MLSDNIKQLENNIKQLQNDLESFKFNFFWFQELKINEENEWLYYADLTNITDKIINKIKYDSHEKYEILDKYEFIDVGSDTNGNYTIPWVKLKIKGE